MTRPTIVVALTAVLACLVCRPALAATNLYVTDTVGDQLWGFSVADDGTLAQIDSETVEANASSIAFDNEAELMWVGSSSANEVTGFTVAADGTLTPGPATATTSAPTSIAADPFQHQLLTVLGGAPSSLQSWSRSEGTPVLGLFGDPDAAGTNATDLVHYTSAGTTYVLEQDGVEMYAGGFSFPESIGNVPVPGASSIAIHQRLGVVYVGTAGGEIRMFSIAGDGTLQEMTPAFTPADTPVRMVVHPDGSALYATAAGGGVLQMAIDTSSGELSDIGAGIVASPNQTGMQGIAITPDGDHVFTTSTGGTAGVQHFEVDEPTLGLTAGAPTMPGGQTDGTFDGLAIAVSPDQPADAELDVTGPPAVVGDVGTFDAGNTVAADGDDVTSFEFQWGDGTPPASGPDTVAQHTFNTPGVFEVRVRVEDETGTSIDRVFDGRSTLRNGGSESLAHEVVSIAPASPPPPSDAGSGLFLTSGNSVIRFGLGAAGVPSGGSPIGGGHGPAQLVPSPDGRSLYVPSQGAEGRVIAQYDVTASGALSPKPAGLAPSGLRPRWMAVTPDGRFAYASNFEDGDISVYTVGASGQLVPNGPDEPLGPEPAGLAIHPSGDTLYAFYEGSVQRFAIAADGTLSPVGAPLASGIDMQDAAVTPNGTALYGLAFGALWQYAINADRSLTPRPLQPIPCQANGLAVSPDGRNAYVGCLNGGNTVRIFDIAADGSLGNQRGAVAANGLGDPAVSPDGGSVYVPGLGQTFLFDRAPNGNLTPKSTPTLPNGGNGAAISPSQAPVARFAVNPAPAGQPTAFDARSSSDPDGTVVRYDWDFGDGTSLPNGGPTPTHVYAAPGVYAPRLTVTDAEGTSTTRVFTGAAVVRNGGPTAMTARFVTVAPGPLAQQPAPVPDYRETVLVDKVSGRVLVKVPGSRRFVPIEELTEIPVGSIVDATRGRVELIVETGDGGPVQRAVFYGGIFQVKQLAGATGAQRRRRARPLTELALRGKVGPCGRTARRVRAGSTADAAARKRKKRRLWGNGKGRFRTKGRYSSATVRGTHWLVEDRCDGTLTRVRSGSVTVRDFVRKRNIVVKRGKRYLARPKPRRRR